MTAYYTLRYLAMFLKALTRAIDEIWWRLIGLKKRAANGAKASAMRALVGANVREYDRAHELQEAAWAAQYTAEKNARDRSERLEAIRSEVI